MMGGNLMYLRQSPWFLATSGGFNRSLRLFCTPFAGGNASAYAPWQAAIDPSIEVVPVQLPGRGSRIREAAVDSIDRLADQLADAMMPRLDMPYAMFGHSMGALLAFETLQRLREAGAPSPIALFVSARRAPHIPSRRPPLYSLPDDLLIEELRGLNGTPRIVLEDKELLDLILPVLRADLRAVETHRYGDVKPFDFPIHAFGGARDSIPEADISAWSAQTTAASSLTMFAGDHFYLNAHRDGVLRAIELKCAPNRGVV